MIHYVGPVELGPLVLENNRIIWLKFECSAWSKHKLNTKKKVNTALFDLQLVDSRI